MSQPTDRTAFDDLLSALATAFEAERRPGGDQAAAALLTARTQPYRRVHSAADPSALLDVACAHPCGLPLTASIRSCRHLIDWTNWEGTGLAPAISQKLYSAELLGPDGHVACPDVRVGLLLSAADTDYPVSSHSGEETHLVVSGIAEWTVAGGPYLPQEPGTLVHHPAWVPHGRRTLAEPFLGAWRWSGDLDLASFRVA